MATYSLKTVQKIPVTLPEAWNFFASASNLQSITPEAMGFRIISKHHGEKLYAGQIIEYIVRPVFSIRMYWMTEITQVKDKEYFIDEQRKGPYSMWHHQHHFKEIEGGVEMTDIVHYRLPMGFLGKIANSLFVKKKLQHIFNYRYERIKTVLGKWHEDPTPSIEFE